VNPAHPERAADVRSAPTIVDAHLDLLLELEAHHGEDRPFGRRWLHNLAAGNVGLQVCPIYTADLSTGPELALRRALRQAREFHRAVAENADRVFAVREAEDLSRVEQGDGLGLMLSMEGVDALGYDAELIEVFHGLGVRMASLTWNRRNAFADGAAEPESGGLSRLGFDLIARMREVGVMIDLVHASERTFWDVIDHADGAHLLVSHGACRGVFDTPRNLSDDQLRALAEAGGVLGVILMPIAIDRERWTLDRVIDHIDHAVSVAGIEHVGLGGDFFRQIAAATALTAPADSLLPAGMGFDSVIEGLEGPEHYGRLVEALSSRGYGPPELEALLRGNFLRLFRAALHAIREP
jgi:membrane dipeptidase